MMRPRLFLLFCLTRCILKTRGENVNTSAPGTSITSQAMPTSVDYQSAVMNIPITKETSSMVAFEDFFSLEAEDIIQCLQRNDRLMFHALSGQISFSIAPNPTQVQRCDIEVTVPDDKGMEIYVSLNSSSCEDTDNESGTDVYYKESGIYDECPSDIPHSYLIPGSDCSVVIIMKPSVAPYAHLFFNFTIIPRPRIEIDFISATTGYVQSPGWDGRTKYPVLFSEQAEVRVPAEHIVMISFLQLNIERSPNGYCTYDRLTITIVEKKTSSDKKVLKLCKSSLFPEPEIYHTDLLTFKFVADNTVQYSGFKVLFSFHRYPSVPVKTPSGLWNCSVDYWPHFQQHMGMCNSVNECYAGEDEANCSHLYQGCERGSISIGGRCYELVVRDGNITWSEAADECFRRNSYLASLNTPEEWDQITEFAMTTYLDKIYVGLRTTGSNFPELYRRGFQWTDGTPGFFFQIIHNEKFKVACFYLRRDVMEMVDCYKSVKAAFLCEKNISPVDVVPQTIHLQTEEWSGNNSHVTCPAGHMTWKFLACDLKTRCWTSQMDSSSVCNAPVVPQPPSFVCNNGVERVSYTLVCDHRQDCSDNSDENFCFFPPCRNAKDFQCVNKQCILRTQRCDKIEQCLDGTDEQKCSNPESSNIVRTARPPAVIDFSHSEGYTIRPIRVAKLQGQTSERIVCPVTHFLCPGNWSYCMPVFIRCNGVFDCPGGEDEIGCDSYVCPGFYRCRDFETCVHATHVCDGIFQCPLRDDELLCDLVCPVNCVCLGLAFFCSGLFPFKDFPELRYLDGQGSAIKLEDLQTNTMLIFINVAKCGITHFAYVEFPNLRTLDLSQNQLKTIKPEDFISMKKLQVLSLARNPLASLFISLQDPEIFFSSLLSLDMSEILLDSLNISTFSVFPTLVTLNLSGCGIERLVGGGFHLLPSLKYLDLEKCPMNDFPKDVFQGLITLAEVWADNYKLCCPANLPKNFNSMYCHSPSDEISSCDALLRSDVYRITLSLFSTLALVGNLCSFIYRVFVTKVKSNLGFDVFVTHLCVSDFLMGVYLAVIGVADRLFMGTYVWNDNTWKKSSVCGLAGFLSLLSSEVSAFIICLITFERFLVLRFPLSRLHFKKKSAHFACGIAWLVGIIVAGIPLLPMTSHWEFYSQNGICISLPITRNTFAGHDYSFIIMIVVNFILFLLIATGQVFIYWSIRANSVKSKDSTKKSKDLTIARRLIAIAMSDFLCWFPVGLLGVLASTGVPISGEVNVAIAIIILPVNSAINPFLYTINILLERQNREQEKRLMNSLMSEITKKYEEKTVDAQDDGTYTKRDALNLIKTWLTKGVMPLDSLETIITNEYEKKLKQTEPTQ